MPLVKLSDDKGINLDLVTHWEMRTEAPPEIPEAPRATASKRSRRSQGDTPEESAPETEDSDAAAPESAAPAALQEGEGKQVMLLYTLSGHELRFEGHEAQRLHRYLSGRSGILP